MALDKHHIVHYLIILGLVVLGIGGTGFLTTSREIQIAWVISVAFLYMAYGILHHYLEHDLTVKIVIEYALVAMLAISLFIFVKGGA